MTPAPPERALPPRYYLGNFERLCATVREQYGDLLSDRETECLDRFSQAGTDARCLFVRLASRRGPLFRVEALDYPELDDQDAALAENLDRELLLEAVSPPLEDLVRVLRRDELMAVGAMLLPLTGRERKQDLVEQLLMLPEAELIDAWRDWREPGQRLVEVAYRAEIELFQILFFGNSYQTLTEFVLSDLGIATYPDYVMDRDHRLFGSREEIDDYQAMRALKAVYKDAVAAELSPLVSEIGRLLLADGCEGLMATPYRHALRNRVARQLERYALHEEALALYACSEQHPARERSARLLASSGDAAAALAVCEAIEAAPRCEAEVDFARRQLPTLRRRLGRDYVPLRRDRFAEDRLVLPRQHPVEQAAADYYGRDWQQVRHTESRLINASFGLAFWEQIFQPVPGAFINPFQAAPLDMYSPGFYAARRASIDRRMSELGAADLEAELLTAWDRYEGTSNRWVGWRGLDRELFTAALRCIPLPHWIAFWRRLLFDPEANRNGCPDLVALDPDRGYCFIEVKGPGDQLQLNQRRWLRYFQQLGVPAKVAWVDWADD